MSFERIIKLETRKPEKNYDPESIKKLTDRQLGQLSEAAQISYKKRLERWESEIRYLKRVREDLKRLKPHEGPDTYRNYQITETRLENQIKYASDWFYEIYRWFDMLRHSKISQILLEVINDYILKETFPWWSYERGLEKPLMRIKISIHVKVEE